MTSGGEAAPTLRRAVLLMTASSLLVPAAGVLTQPILAQALGVEGRGALAAAIAPAVLAISVATLGLPDALVYYLAKRPGLTRKALMWAALMSVVLGLVCLLLTVLALPFLSGGDAELGSLIVLGMSLTVPALLVGVLRGAATGRQMWSAVASERLVNTALRIVAFVLLWVLGELTVLAAVLVSTLSPLVCGVVYWRLLLRPPTDAREVSTDPADDPYLDRLADGIARPLVSYGSRVWLGSVAEMLLSRMGQILMTPLAGVVELGLFSVATTIADLPLILAIAIQGTLFGFNSKTRDAGKVQTTTRLTVLVTMAGCVVLGGTLPFWIGRLFGDEFQAATVPTLMLMLSAIVCIPGLMAAVGLSAWGRPGLRSSGLTITLAVNLVVLLVLVPALGAIGACWASIASNVVMSSYMIVTAGRVMNVRRRDFVVVRPSDVGLAWREGRRLLSELRSRGRGRPRDRSEPGVGDRGTEGDE
ncbi:lipopolysaccharide biosynthesis protein [Actinomycetospora rhizophila]|uniref:Lipopolysaccharide biosynthesis protein n=1 Tax=Actinomycetospora rhizophila TaxID=1416876 RepID=A0ABV9ZKZ8_9PSEU